MATTESSAVRAMTPPSAVRKDRILFSRSVVSAICAFSPSCMCITAFTFGTLHSLSYELRCCSLAKPWPCHSEGRAFCGPKDLNLPVWCCLNLLPQRFNGLQSRCLSRSIHTKQNPHRCGDRFRKHHRHERYVHRH